MRARKRGVKAGALERGESTLVLEGREREVDRDRRVLY
jgi:hypothetical protein